MDQEKIIKQAAEIVETCIQYGREKSDDEGTASAFAAHLLLVFIGAAISCWMSHIEEIANAGKNDHAKEWKEDYDSLSYIF